MNVGHLRKIDLTSLLERKALSVLILSFGFGLTGAGTVMLGIVLPVLSHQWGLRDERLGLLLFLQFFGSGLGAIFTGLNRVRSLAIGYGLLVASLCVLAFGGLKAAQAAFLFYGLGLGMAMTSTSLLFSDRWGEGRAAKLEWLNFAWSVGATMGPICFVPFLSHGKFRSVFLMMVPLFLGAFFWVVLFERQESDISLLQRTRPFSRLDRAAFSMFLILAMGFVGVEVSLGGWLTTYSHRAGVHNLAGAALATAIFWFGEMLSRLAFSTRILARVGRQVVLRWGIAGVTVAMCALIAVPKPSLIFVVAGAAGACVGPLYPLSLSYLLELSPWGWYFAAGGIGAAVFPWVTGIVSDHFHSLRYGLVVPFGAGLALMALNALTFRILGSKDVSPSVRAESISQ